MERDWTLRKAEAPRARKEAQPQEAQSAPRAPDAAQRAEDEALEDLVGGW